MKLFDKIRYFFQKRANDFDANETFRRNQLRYNALYALDPDVLVRHLTAFERGDICGLERVIEEFETREDKMRIGAFKMAAAVASKPWEIRVNKGEEDTPRAKLHQETLTRFWNGIDVTDAFCRNRRGGLRLLVKQMMSAQSRVYAVHDIVWKVNGDGSLKATFTQVPAWCFENRTGRLRYIHNDGETHGEEMRDGEWLVTVGEGVGIAAVVIAMAKRLSWNDWLLFSSACGMPVIMGNTSAQKGTPAWEAMERAIRAVAPRTGILADTGTQLSAVSMGGNGQQTYRELIDVVDRAISALYRGGDLATMSSGPDAAGVNAQDGESELMDADGCAMVSETLRDQVERFVIRFTCGDFEPLAGIVINPPAETEDIDREIKIDQHLAQLGVRLSKADALQRYGRTEAKDEDDALQMPNAPVADPAHQKMTPQDMASLIYPLRAGGYKISKPAVERAVGLQLEEIAPAGDQPPALPNERTEPPTSTPPAPPLQNAKTALQNASKKPDGQGEVEDARALLGAFLKGYEKDAEPAAKAVKELLSDFTPEKAKALIAKLPSLIPDDPAMAAVLAEAMAAEFAGASSAASAPQGAEKLANVKDANGMEHAEDGKFTGDGGGSSSAPSGRTEKKAEEHTPEQQKRIEEYEASTDQKVVDFVRKMDSLDNDERNGKWIAICNAPATLGTEIGALTGMDATGWGVELHGNHVRHSDKRHGGSGAHDHSMADIEHYGRIGYVINHFDSVELLKDQAGNQVYSEEYKNSQNKPSPVVNVKMRIDGTMAVQQAVQDAKRKKLQIISVRIEK